MGKLLIKKKTEQVCHDFDQFLPVYAAVKDQFNSKAAYKFIAHFLPFLRQVSIRPLGLV